MKVLLSVCDPHPTKGSHLVADWWGREITVGEPFQPGFAKTCNTQFIFPILGPPELLEFLSQHDLGKFVCTTKSNASNSKPPPTIRYARRPTFDDC